MPKAKVESDVGYLETQWANNGRLICIVSATVQKNSDTSITTTTVMHQFTAPGDVGVFIRDLARARRNAFPDKDDNDVSPSPSKLSQPFQELNEDDKEKNSCYDVLIDHYSNEIAGILKNNTVGDNTWSGLLQAFLLDILRTNEPTDDSRLFKLMKNGFNIETFMALDPKNRNLLLGIPEDEMVSYISYVNMFNEIH